MITRDEIAAETENALNETEQSMWLTLIRDYPGYSAAQYPDVSGQLSNVSGIKAKQLLAALRKIEALGSDTMKLSGGRDAIVYDSNVERNALIAYGLSVLYEASQVGFYTPPFMVVGCGE